jgi:hypothetical protein
LLLTPLLRDGHPHRLAPIRGGSEEAESFEPSLEDWRDYQAWRLELDRRRAWDEQTAAWNAERWEAGERP